MWWVWPTEATVTPEASVSVSVSVSHRSALHVMEELSEPGPVPVCASTAVQVQQLLHELAPVPFGLLAIGDEEAHHVASTLERRHDVVDQREGGAVLGPTRERVARGTRRAGVRAVRLPPDENRDAAGAMRQLERGAGGA